MKKGNLYAFVFLAIVCCVSAARSQDFFAMRGKRSIPESTYFETAPTEETSNGQAEIVHQDDQSMNNVDSPMDKRAPAGFLGMRGKKPSEDWNYLPQQEYSMGYFKRAPSGFLGMRGKKENYYYDDAYYKRAPSGFMGMRGKKSYDLVDNGFGIYEDKRVPAGFVGMRGKKNFEPFLEEVKRAPNSGFFGMRGKKQPGRSGFFGMRGKKYPYEFRGKFVGVRENEAFNPVRSELLDQQNPPQL